MKVSVIVPVRDEEQTVRTLLDSLFRQTRRPDEVVIVDGGSRDGTVEVVEGYVRRNIPIKLVRTKDAFPGEARNRGVLAAKHDIIAFTDAGISVDPRWLKELCRPLEEDRSVDVVYGSYEPITDSFFNECAAMAYVPAPGKTGIRGPFIASSLMKRSVWEFVGGFRPFRAAEDLIFMERIYEKGFRIAYAPGAIVHWQMVPGWKATFRRFAEYSFHNLLAGRARHWHFGVVRMYAAAIPFFVLAAVHSGAWMLVPIAGFTARVARMAYRKRLAFCFRDVFRPKRLFYLSALLLLLDVATLWGACRYLLCDGGRFSGGSTAHENRLGS